MAISLIKNPVGHKLSESEVDAIIVNQDGDAAIYMDTGHGLSDGDYVYIQSNFESYNGYKYIDSYAYDGFKIRNSPNESNIEHIQDATITYRTSVLNHGWQAVHNPIVYELESNIYPNNTIGLYSPIVVSFITNSNGYTAMLGSSAYSFLDVKTLDYITLVGDNDLAGVYQIIEKIDSDEIVIDLAYDVSNSFTGLEILKWYNNYAINVRVVAGIEPTHRWAALKPYEVAATLQFIPDNDGKVKFSISDILKSYITTRNNLTLDTLPNNLDFIVSFYIQYFETYDQSDGVEITTYEGQVTTDDFAGTAVNAMMPFKNESISHMSEYINEDVYLAKWLTLQERPIAVVGRFFDLSFINQFLGSDIIVTISGVETITITNPGYGVIRVPITPLSGYTEYCVQASASGTAGIPEAPAVTSAITLPSLSSGVNIASSGTDWTLGANPSLVLSTTGAQISDIWANLYSFVNGYTYTFTPSVDYSFAGTSILCKIRFYILDGSDNIVYTQTFDFLSGAIGTLVTPIIFVSGSLWAKYGFRISSSSGSARTENFDINSITATQTTPVIPAIPGIPAQVITEQICIDIIEECETTFIVEPDDIRLTEDGDFRILE